MTRVVAILLSLVVLLVRPGWTQAGPSLADTPKPQDPFIGTWKMNPDKSELDSNHRAKAAMLIRFSVFRHRGIDEV